MKKQRFKTRKPKVITLQEAWDVISEHLNERKYDSGHHSHCYFVDSNTDYGYIALHTSRYEIVVKSTKKYK